MDFFIEPKPPAGVKSYKNTTILTCIFILGSSSKKTAFSNNIERYCEKIL